MKLRCKLGFHKWYNWKKTGFTSEGKFNYNRCCINCPKVDSGWFYEREIEGV